MDSSGHSFVSINDSPSHHGDHNHSGHKHRQAMNSSLAGSALSAPSPHARLAEDDDQPSEEVKAETQRARTKLILVSFLCLCFMVAEVVGGILANSLAIMTDAAHLLSDLAGFFISIFALWISSRPATSKLSFGFHRAEILGALLSVLLIWLLTGVLVYEAVMRIYEPVDVDGKTMFIVASMGLGVNIAMGCILHDHGHGHGHGHDHNHGHSHSHSHGHGHKHSHKHAHGDHEDGHQHSSPQNVNIRAAYLHVLGDLVQSIGVMIAAAVIWWRPQYRLADPICTFLFSLLVLGTTVTLVRESVSVLMEGTPKGIEPEDVRQRLMQIEGVIDVHDLHIWSLSLGKPALSVHIIKQGSVANVLCTAQKVLTSEFGIKHSTIQVECSLEDHGVSCDLHDIH